MNNYPEGHWSEELPKEACTEALLWAREQSTMEAAWAACDRGDWMLWLAGKWCGDETQRKRLVLAACECARLALPYVKDGETHSLKAIETAEQWARGADGVSLADVRRAADAGYAAADAAAADAYAADAAAAYAAAYAAADAADAADAYAANAANAANAAAADAYAANAANAAAADAADAAACAADAADAYAAARTKTLAKCADIVRRHYPQPPTKP